MSPSGQSTTTPGSPGSPDGGRRKRHVPQRTCVACRRPGDQRTFVRLVRGADGGVEIDERGRAPGRGAYLCRAAACWERGARGALHHPLRTSINEAGRALLMAYGEQFTGTQPEASANGAPPTPQDPPAATTRPAESEHV